jgi:hypothetical protein
MAQHTSAALVISFLLFWASSASATADGPDYWEVRDVAEDDVLNMRSSPDFKSPKVAEIPHDATCIRNMGCKGGLTFEEFSTLSEAQKQQVLKQRPRWCRVNYDGTTAWVAGRYLKEATCDEKRSADAKETGIDPYNHVYVIDKEKVVLKNGHARKVIPGTTTIIITEVIRRPVHVDLDGDGEDEVVVLLMQHTGGSGTFYYLAAASKEAVIDAIYLGDRIKTRPLEAAGDMVIVNYLDRETSQPMSSSPLIEKRGNFRLFDNALVPAEAK